jgi:CcmD family protein
MFDERNYQFMFYGFAAAWAILVIYVVTLVSRGSKIQTQIETLKRMVEERGHQK